MALNHIAANKNISDYPSDAAIIGLFEDKDFIQEIKTIDNKLDGLWTSWFINGQKKFEKTFKMNELISKKCWDEDGNECVCSDLGRGCK